MKTFLRILIICAIVLILIFLSIGIVRIIPKAINSLASASVSIGSLFSGKDKNATTTTTTVTDTNTGGGFIVSSSTTSTTSDTDDATTTSTSTRTLKDILTPNFNKYPANNYIPTPGPNPLNDGYRTVRPASTGGTRTTNTCVAGGAPDLAITILSKGIIDKNSGQFVATNNFTTSDNVSIKFKVENRGSCPTGTWSLHTQLPSSNSADQVRNVNNVGPLPAGTAVTGEAHFDAPTLGTPSAVLTVADNSGRDVNTSNNTAVASLSVLQGNGGSNNGTTSTTGDGRPDLLAQVVRVGTLDYNNNFIASNGSSFRAGDRVAMQFSVTNQGRSATGPWNFQATLSGDGYSPKIYNNPQNEASLAAGARTTYIIAFDNISPGNNIMTVSVDNNNQVNEFNESNNTATIGFSTY